MASLKTTKRLLKVLTLESFLAEPGHAITAMVFGQHGNGKTQSIHQMTTEIGGRLIVVEGASIGEKELTGLPFAAPTSDGSTEVRYVKHNAINSIFNLERFYFEKATKEGFLNGTIKVEFDGPNKVLVVDGKKTVVETEEDAVINGEDNKYKFGEYLSPELKFKLIETGEIKPIVLFIDEINRTDIMIQKELMNIILNRNVSGYSIPWFVNIIAAGNPSSQNSSYQTNEMDPAQLDRFLKLKAESTIDEWVEYGMKKNLNSDIMKAITISEQIFKQKDSSMEDNTEMAPSPRSWEMVCHLYENLERIYKTKFFTAEERANLEDDFRILLRGKVGETAARSVLENLARKDSNIDPEEILDLKSLKIDPKIKNKFDNLKRLSQKIISNNLALYIIKNIAKFKAYEKSSKSEEKSLYMNFKSQLKEFVVDLDPATQADFVKKVIDDGGMKVYTEVAPCFSRDVLKRILETSAALRDLNKE